MRGSTASKLWVVVLVMTMVVALVGCGTQQPSGQQEPANQPPAQQEPADQQPKSLGKLVVSLGTAPPDPTVHFMYYALEQGFFKANGLDVEILPLKGDLNSIRAVASGDADVSWTGISPVFEANERGASFKVISCFAPRIDYILVGRTDIKSPKELEGRNLGVSTPGAVSHEVPKLLMEEDGADPAKANVVAIGGSSSRIAALISGDIDAAALNALFAKRAEDYDYLHYITDAGQMLPDYLYSCEIASAPMIKERPEALQAFVQALSEAIKWAYANPDGATAITQKVLPDDDKELLAYGVNQFIQKHFWNETGKLRPEVWQFTQEQAVKAGVLDETQAYDEWVVTTFVDQIK